MITQFNLSECIDSYGKTLDVFFVKEFIRLLKDKIIAVDLKEMEKLEIIDKLAGDKLI